MEPTACSHLSPSVGLVPGSDLAPGPGPGWPFSVASQLQQLGPSLPFVFFFPTFLVLAHDFSGDLNLEMAAAKPVINMSDELQHFSKSKSLWTPRSSMFWFIFLFVLNCFKVFVYFVLCVFICVYLFSSVIICF